MLHNDWESVIGLEIHAQLSTDSKLFSAESTKFGAAINENVSPVSLGLPGALPVLNKKAVLLAIKTGHALHCDIQEVSIFSRKNYFYPDLAKGYQISQFDQPICKNGYVDFYVDDQVRRVHLQRAHLEEDAGKSIHYGEYTLVDYNRAGIPLLEIVTYPEIRTPTEAAEFMKAVRDILRFVETSDGNLEQGSLRCDCNVSVRKKGDERLGTRVEIKNINSFRFVEKAVEYEIYRQIQVLETGGQLDQETRLYDSVKNKTYTMRKKEEAQDYRYFPDPDLLPLKVSSEEIKRVKASVPVLPFEKIQSLVNELGLSLNDAKMITQEKNRLDFFEKVNAQVQDPKRVVSWMLGDLLAYLNQENRSIEELNVQQFIDLIKEIQMGHITNKMAKEIVVEMYQKDISPQEIIANKGLKVLGGEEEITKWVDQILKSHPQQVQDYLSGKEKLFGFFVGQVMKQTKGQADPERVNQILKARLGSL